MATAAAGTFEASPIAPVEPEWRRAHRELSRLARARLPRCGCCGRKVLQGYDARERRWRHLDFAGMRVELRYCIRRVDCPCCGVQTELVPWAEAGSSFMRDFEDVVALLAQRTDKTTVSELMGTAWETVGNIARRVLERRGPTDLLDGLSRVGIDESRTSDVTTT